MAMIRVPHTLPVERARVGRREAKEIDSRHLIQHVYEMGTDSGLQE